MKSIKVNCQKIEISNDNKICIIAGPCQLETEQHAIDMAGRIQEITKKFNLGFIYKTSFDKANRTSLEGKRGAGLPQEAYARRPNYSGQQTLSGGDNYREILFKYKPGKLRKTEPEYNYAHDFGLDKSKTESVNFGIKSSSLEQFLISNKIRFKKPFYEFSKNKNELRKLLENSTVYIFCKK